MGPHRKAVVVGATSGIGEACAHHLAANNWQVIAVGRGRPGRAEKICEKLTQISSSSKTATNEEDIPKHEFRECDAFSLGEVKKCSDSIIKDHDSIDALVMSQGMATIQSYTSTVDGNDEKLTLHYWSRFAFASLLLPQLKKSTMTGGPVVLSVLSGGVHSSYKKFREDPELKSNYSVQNAADIAGFYNDLGFDALARKAGNEKVNFVHAAPGFVNTNWGTEMPFYLRGPIRMMQIMGKKPGKCANFMLDPVYKSSKGEALLARPDDNNEGLYVMNQNAEPASFTKAHNQESREFVWNVTAEVLGRVGIDIN